LSCRHTSSWYTNLRFYCFGRSAFVKNLLLLIIICKFSILSFMDIHYTIYQYETVEFVKFSVVLHGCPIHHYTKLQNNWRLPRPYIFHFPEFWCLFTRTQQLDATSPQLQFMDYSCFLVPTAIVKWLNSLTPQKWLSHTVLGDWKFSAKVIPVGVNHLM